MTPPDTSALDQAIGTFLGDLRRSRAVSQETLATQLGYRQSVISKAEKGQRRVTLSECLLWANALGVPFDDLVRGIERLWDAHASTTSIWSREDDA